MARPNIRNLVSMLACGVGLPETARALQKLTSRVHIRAVNAHATPPHLRDNMRRQLEMLRMWFEPARLADVAELLDTGSWRGEKSGKPGLLFCYDDGGYTNYSVAAPTLEEFGFSGLFFLPVGFLDCPIQEQAAWAKARDISANPETDSAPDGRLAMTWEEARSLLAKHEIGAHTRTHCRMWPTVSADQIRDEIVVAKRDLEGRIGQTVDSFCYVGGEVAAHSPIAAAMIREARFKLAFSTGSAPITEESNPLSLQRTQLEADFPLTRAKVSGSGLIDLYFYPRRRSIVAAMEDESALALIQEWEKAQTSQVSPPSPVI
jgi:peptidoglycan/xylan/chitin deacetylase (PgdA/CDA1 family)